MYKPRRMGTFVEEEGEEEEEEEQQQQQLILYNMKGIFVSAFCLLPIMHFLDL